MVGPIYLPYFRTWIFLKFKKGRSPRFRPSLKDFADHSNGIWHLKAALHLEAGPIRCVKGLLSSLVIGQKAQIGPNPFTPRGRGNLVV
jgi:hypothetical protein